jgi:hypothetical protein
MRSQKIFAPRLPGDLRHSARHAKDELERRLQVFGGNHFGIGPAINLHGIEFRAVLPQAG